MDAHGGQRNVAGFDGPVKERIGHFLVPIGQAVCDDRLIDGACDCLAHGKLASMAGRVQNEFLVSELVSDMIPSMAVHRQRLLVIVVGDEDVAKPACPPRRYLSAWSGRRLRECTDDHPRRRRAHRPIRRVLHKGVWEPLTQFRV
jgi:hypothetical protein